MTRDELLRELEKRYGRFSFTARDFDDHPPAQIFFHNKTGFSIGLYRLDTKEGHITDSGELQQKYRVDK